MKNRLIKILAAVLLILAVLTVLGCGSCGLVGGCIPIPIGYIDEQLRLTPPPEEVKIDGVTYVTGFYPKNTKTAGAVCDNPKAEPLLYKQPHEFRPATGYAFDLLVCDNLSENLLNPVAVYCRKDQLEEVKAYYGDNGNYDYYFYIDKSNTIKIDGECNKDYLDVAVDYAYKMTDDQANDPCRDKGFDKEEFVLSEQDYREVSLIRRSKDGVFESPVYGWYYVDGKLYALKPFLLSTMDYEGKELDNYPNLSDTFYHLTGVQYDHVLDLFESYVLSPSANA